MYLYSGLCTYCKVSMEGMTSFASSDEFSPLLGNDILRTKGFIWDHYMNDMFINDSHKNKKLSTKR